MTPAVDERLNEIDIGNVDTKMERGYQIQK